jgi:hypothetical protein
MRVKIPPSPFPLLPGERVYSSPSTGGARGIGVKISCKSSSSRRDGPIVARRFIAGIERPGEPSSSPWRPKDSSFGRHGDED